MEVVLLGANKPLSNKPSGYPFEFDIKLSKPPPIPLVTVCGSVSLLVQIIVSFIPTVISPGSYHCRGVKLVILTSGFADPSGIVILFCWNRCAFANKPVIKPL